MLTLVGSMNFSNLSTDQAPPLAVPITYFAVVPWALASAGILLLIHPELLADHWSPITLAWTHMGTLGLLLAPMLGALEQILPVLLGSPVQPIISNYYTIGLLVIAMTALTIGWLLAMPVALWVASSSLAISLLGLTWPLAMALLRSSVRSPTAVAMKGAWICLIVLVLLGLRLLLGHATGLWPTDRQGLLAAHIVVALLGWVGTLTMAVAWHVVPMFYLTPPMAKRSTTILAVGVPSCVIITAALAGIGAPVTAIVGLALPAAVVVWLVHPWQVIHMLGKRKRKRADPSLLFWQMSMLLGPAVFIVAAVTVLSQVPMWPMLLGWLAIFGWAGGMVHGMMSRIIAFLLWFHRYAARTGLEDVPTMKGLLPDQQVRANFYVHVGTLLVGVHAIASGSRLSAQATGIALIITSIAWNLLIWLPFWRAHRHDSQGLEARTAS